ncbi:uncharacterized protein LOC128221790 [Mya arenaria]|uniref:uncharacterized protein LOC128221790 n=1 Tax=Mya arenaria TaxID=6604 RepID=UPI0022E166D4|nr:uncharacterized protein LOC128221790 [Mya arenaria]
MESVQLYIQERPSYPILGPMPPDFNTTGCIYVYNGSDVYCKTENGTEPVHVALLIGHDSFVLTESKGNKGLYIFSNVHQQMAGLSRRNVTCQVSNAALETPYEVHGILCNVEKGSPPVLAVPEFLVGESSTAVCEVRDAIPAPAIEMHVGAVLLADVQQTDSFNTSSNTFTSRAKAKKINKSWNGNEMCCMRQSRDYLGLKAVSTCTNINMKFPPLDLSITANKIHEYSKNVSVCFLNISCETNESNPPCRIEWSSDNDNITIVQSNNWTNGGNGSYRSVSNVLYTVTEDMAEGTISCATKCDHFPSNLNKDYKIFFSGKKCQDNDVQTFSSIFRNPVTNLLIGTGVFCGLCIVFAIGRYIFLKRLKVNAINTVEIVENHSDTSSENDVIHISTEGVRYAVVQRQPGTQRIETQQPHNDDSLTYAELDINYLQEAHARVPSRRNDTRTEYADIEFHSTQTPAVEDPVYDNASTKI